MRMLIVAAGVFALTACGQQASETDGQADATAAAETVPAATTPSFDCAKAESEAEKLVCQDENLAGMDRELARLYKLADTGPYATPARKKELEAMQRGWVKGRDDCWKAENKNQCVMTAYAQRIHELRQGYADARTQDDQGVSTGPLALACKGIDFGVSATFIKTEPGAVFLQWNDSSIALDHVPSGSGEKYQGLWDGKIASLLTKGDEALLTLPGEPERTCKIEEIG